jgi:hypothetical protein
MKLAISLVSVLLLALSTAAVAAEVELGEISRPVDAQATTEEEAALMPAQAEEVEAEAEGPYRLEEI